MGTKTVKRGRKPNKIFKISPGELKTFPILDRFNLRYRANAEGWELIIRQINGKLLVFRKR